VRGELCRGKLCAVNCRRIEKNFCAFTRKFLLFHSMIVVSSSEFMIIACVLLGLRQKLFSTVHLWRLYTTGPSSSGLYNPILSQYHHLDRVEHQWLIFDVISLINNEEEAQRLSPVPLL
jgi:hypothetical protein